MVGDVSNPLGRRALGQADHNRATNNLNAIIKHKITSKSVGGQNLTSGETAIPWAVRTAYR